MAILSSIQSTANVCTSRTFVTNDLLDEESLKTLRNELKVSKSGKYSRSLGAFIEEKNCTLEKAQSYSIKTSVNKMRGSKTTTLFCNSETAEGVLKAHPTAVILETLQEALNKAAQDV